MKLRKVPFQALGGVFEQDDINAALKVMQAAAQPGGSFFPLPEENDFQKALAEHEGAERAVIVNSCGTALDLCMMVLNIGPDDEVIIPGQTFVCTATCAANRGAKVVFADIDPKTMCLDPRAVEKKITDKTKAIIPVHFAGHCCDVEAFDAISKNYNIPVIYDAAHALNAKYKGLPIGKWGLASCYSFQSNKNMTTLGEGGAVVTNDADFAEKVRQGKTFGYVYEPQLRIVSIGFNYRMSKVQAAVGINQLAKIEKTIAKRLEKTQRLTGHLKSVSEILLPVDMNEEHGCHLFIIQLDLDKLACDRDAFRKMLDEKFGVGTGLHYPAVWSWEVAKEFDYDNNDCPITKRVCNSVVTLPVFPNTSDEDLEYVAWSIKQLISRVKK